MNKIYNYIGGKHVPAISGNWIDNYDPAIGDVYGLLPDSDDKDVEKAYLAAQKAFTSWSKKSTQSR